MHVAKCRENESMYYVSWLESIRSTKNASCRSFIRDEEGRL